MASQSHTTTDHKRIKKWVEERGGKPATVSGTGTKDDEVGILRVDFPGYAGAGLTEVSWDEWLATFDKRRLNFIYQQKLSNGKRSNFFRLESPDREDG